MRSPSSAPPKHYERPASSATISEIERLLRAQLQPTHLEVRDDSAAHAGHPSASGRGHFRLRIVSSSFTGLTSLQRHRRVNALLAPLWDRELHALGMELLAPEEVVQKSS